jgi:hypothetical protein
LAEPLAARGAFPTHVAFDAFDRDRDANPSEKAASRTDGVYGRFDGDLSLEPFVGASFTYDGMLTDLGVSAYYFHTVGFSAQYADGRLFPTSARSDFNVTSLSLALRPLFLLRWSKDLEQGPSWLDLTIDSLTVSVGGYWAEDNQSDESQRGLEAELSLGFPLLAVADGPWIGLVASERFPRVTDDGHKLDLTFGLRLSWAFSLGQ